MTKNPVFNALAAEVYIMLITVVLYYGTSVAKPGPSLMVPVVMISLFTLSAAVMGYIFLSQPIELYLDGKKKAAVELFMKTLLIFAVLAFVNAFSYFSGLIKLP